MRRVFIGVPVNQAAQPQIDKLLYPYQRSSPDISWVKAENRHLTLAFFGDRSDRAIEKLVHSMDNAYCPEKSFQTGFAKLERFPGPGGKIIALIFEAGACLDRLFQVTQGLMQVTGLDSDLKPFRPHVTLARIRKAGGFEKNLRKATNIRLQVDKITLYQSTLTRSGRVYLKLKEVELGQHGN